MGLFKNSKRTCHQKLRSICKLPEMFVLLSPSKSDMINGFGKPFVGVVNNYPSLFLFSTYENAKKWIGDSDFKVDDVYLIGQIPKNGPNGYETFFAIAAAMHIKKVIFDQGTDLFECDVSDIVSIFKISPELSVIIPQKEINTVLSSKSYPIDFNPLKIINFKYMGRPSAERLEELLLHVFDKQFGLAYMLKVPINEFKYVIEYTENFLLPEAGKGNNDYNAKWLKAAVLCYKLLLCNKLKDVTLYTLAEKDTGKMHVVDNTACLFYACRLKHQIMPEYEYQQITDLDMFKKELRLNNVENVEIGDGSPDVYIMTAKDFIKFSDFDKDELNKWLHNPKL